MSDKKKHRWLKLPTGENRFQCANCGCEKSYSGTGIHWDYMKDRLHTTGRIPECKLNPSGKWHTREIL